MNTEVLQRDRPFNPWRVVASDNARNLLTHVLGILSERERATPRVRKRRPLDQQRYERLVGAVTLDVAYQHLTGPEGQIRISRSARVLDWRSRYTPDFYTKKTLPALLDNMLAGGLIVENRGHSGRKPSFAAYTNQTTITAGTRLTELIERSNLTAADIGTDTDGQEIVILKDASADTAPSNLVDYVESEVSTAFRKEVRTLNTWLQQADIRLFTYAEGVPTEVIDHVDTRDRHLKRYFTRSSFESGGRLFGGFWQPMKKAHRTAAILINGHFIEEVDYSTMLPRMLYGKTGATIPANLEHDLYSIPGFERSRQGIKKLFGAMLFGSKLEKWTAFPKETEKHFHPEEVRSVQEVMEAIRAAHHPIKQHFGNGIGHGLQFIESEILIDVLLELKDRGIVALPIHDAVLVPREDVEVARGVMRVVFRRHVGIEGRVS